MTLSDFHKGNYVLSKEHGICRVICTFGDTFRLFTKGGLIVESKDAVPMFLSNEALVVIPGVSLSGNVWIIRDMPGYLKWNNTEAVYQWMLQGLPIRNLTFIHELQQLYLATTTDELYNPKKKENERV